MLTFGDGSLFHKISLLTFNVHLQYEITIWVNNTKNEIPKGFIGTNH